MHSVTQSWKWCLYLSDTSLLYDPEGNMLTRPVTESSSRCSMGEKQWRRKRHRESETGMKSITCCFNKEEPTERRMKTPLPCSAYYREHPRQTPITAGASLAHNKDARNQDWECATRRGKVGGQYSSKALSSTLCLPRRTLLVTPLASSDAKTHDSLPTAPHPAILLRFLIPLHTCWETVDKN